MTVIRRVPIETLYLGLYDGPHATPRPSDDGPIFLGIGNLTEDGQLDLSDIRHIAEEDFAAWTKRVTPQPGDIVFTYEATLNRYARIPDGFRGCLGRRLALIRPDLQKVNPLFLFYYFFGEDWRRTISKNTLSGATVDRIPLTTFPTFEVDLPCRSAQDAIASILSVYDDLIENNTRRIKILEEMARMIYREWFVNFRFPGHEKVKMVESENGLIPHGWSEKRLGDVLQLEYGKALKSEDREGGAVPVFGSSGVVGFHAESLADGPGIIVGRKGNVGSVFFCPSKFWVIDTAYYVRTSLSQYFLFFNLLTQNFLNNDAAVPGLNRNQAHSLPIIVPDATTMERFDQLVAPMFRQQTVLRELNAILTKTRDLLLPKLISGEVNVEHFESEAVAQNV